MRRDSGCRALLVYRNNTETSVSFVFQVVSWLIHHLTEIMSGSGDLPGLDLSFFVWAGSNVIEYSDVLNNRVPLTLFRAGSSNNFQMSLKH